MNQLKAYISLMYYIYFTLRIKKGGGGGGGEGGGGVVEAGEFPP